MYHIDFNQPIHVHFIGIGGISMSGLAEVLLSKGFTVSGSDSKQSELTNHLADKGVIIHIGQTAENIHDGIDLVVYTAAIHPDNPEFAAVVAAGIPMLTRAELLGEIMANFRVAIGVSGTHGKTTTTSMVTEILVGAGLDPTVSVGGILPSIGGNLRLGQSENFITEACEYTNSFLSFAPTIEIILNIEEDHMDFFKDLQDIRNSFHQFALLLPSDGLLVINGDIENYAEICEGVQCPYVTVGAKETCDYSAKNITYDENGCCHYTLLHNGQEITEVALGVPGIHNVYNSLAAWAVAAHLNIANEAILEGLFGFHGTDRRFQFKGELNGFRIVDDYAHHPSEIHATITSAKKTKHNKLVVIFQPHTYTRTKAFLEDFAKELSGADLVILADIYAAREQNTLGIYSTDIKALIDQAGTECIYEPDFSKIQDLVLARCGEGDLVITMGAGNIVEVGEALLSR